MQINHNLVASIHYTLKNDAGETLDSSEGQKPLNYLHGAQNIVPGLEKALEGKVKGDKLSVVVAAEDGYGEHNSELVQELPKSMFTGVETVEVGMEFHAETQYGMQVIEVTKVEGDRVTVDGNHPLAGKNLHFTVDVIDVRDATEEEIAQGRVNES